MRILYHDKAEKIKPESFIIDNPPALLTNYVKYQEKNFELRLKGRSSISYSLSGSYTVSLTAMG